MKTVWTNSPAVSREWKWSIFITHSWHFYALNNETFILTHMEEPIFKMNVRFKPTYRRYKDRLPLCVSQPHTYTHSLICSYFHGHCSPASFIVFDAMNRHQRVPDDKTICPFLPCPGFHPLCPHYFVWVPGSNSQQRHIANTFFLFQLLAHQIHRVAPRVSEYR